MGPDQRPGPGALQGLGMIPQGPLLADDLSGEFGHGGGGAVGRDRSERVPHPGGGKRGGATQSRERFGQGDHGVGFRGSCWRRDDREGISSQESRPASTPSARRSALKPRSGLRSHPAPPAVRGTTRPERSASGGAVLTGIDRPRPTSRCAGRSSSRRGRGRRSKARPPSPCR